MLAIEGYGAYNDKTEIAQCMQNTEQDPLEKSEYAVFLSSE